MPLTMTFPLNLQTQELREATYNWVIWANHLASLWWNDWPHPLMGKGIQKEWKRGEYK